MVLFTYLLGFGGNTVPYLLELRLGRCGVISEIVDRKKIARDKCVRKQFRQIRKSYRTDNAIDEATINLPDFLLVVVDSTSPEGAFCGLSSGTWTDDFRIERPALSRAKLVTAQTQTQPHPKPPSPPDPALKPTYSQALKVPTRPRDPGKPSRDQTPDLSRDVPCVVSNTT